jgi:cellulose synthase/poly-beta-1,6-N-acetylglucosamine synthase-like glycosyltransferase
VIILFPIFLLVMLIFINRYFLGFYLKVAKRDGWDVVVDDYEPTVSVVIPMYNEGKGIQRTVASILALDYPTEKLDITLIDDCSSDDSVRWAEEATRGHSNARVLRNAVNLGKRRSINRAVRHSHSEIIVSVDSDVEVDPQAVRQLLRRFTRPEIAAVGGRVNISNAKQNWLTEMQVIKYYFGYEYMKNLERAFHTVMCLSGCLTAYRRSVLMELEPILEDRSVLGIPIKYGEDRYLTRQIVKAGYSTFSTLDAVCYTVAPSTLSKYFSQQLRWRRSNAIDFFGGMSHVWSLHPLISLQFFTLGALLLSYPLVIATNLIEGSFWDLAPLNAGILIFMGFIYGVRTRNLPPERRAHPLSFLAMAFVMPVTYMLYTPLALFTLDSSSWETRGGGKPTADRFSAAKPSPNPQRA